MGVHLPDCRTQIVDYFVDEYKQYHADVKYEGVPCPDKSLIHHAAPLVHAAPLATTLPTTLPLSPTTPSTTLLLSSTPPRPSTTRPLPSPMVSTLPLSLSPLPTTPLSRDNCPGIIGNVRNYLFLFMK